MQLQMLGFGPGAAVAAVLGSLRGYYNYGNENVS